MIVRRRTRRRKRGKSEEKGKAGKCERVLESRSLVARLVAGTTSLTRSVWWSGKGMCTRGTNKSTAVIVCDYAKQRGITGEQVSS
jgi:hypothetical protein